MKRGGQSTGAERTRWWRNEGSGRCLAAVAGWDSDGTAGRAAVAAAAAVAGGDDSYAAAAAVERRPAAVARWMLRDS
jgi:hypothetical protein